MSNNKSKSNKGLKALAITLAAVIVAAAAYTGLSLGLNSWNPADWVNRVEEVQTEEQISGGGAIIDETKSNGVRLASATIAVADYDEYGISPLAETAYTLTATVYDEDSSSDGIPQDVIYTAEWQNPSSEWATGKDISDYYTVTSTGVNTATATCLQAFGEPIVIKATSYFNEDAYCTWEANYVKRVTNITLRHYFSSSIQWDSTESLSANITYGTGTITGTLKFDSYYVESVSTALSNVSETSYMKYFEQQCQNASVDPDWDISVIAPIDITVEDPNYISDLVNISPYTWFQANMSSEDISKMLSATNSYEYFGYAYSYAADQSTNDIRFSCHYTYTYNGEEYSTGNVLTPYYEIDGDYPQPATVTGNDVDLIY